FNVKQAPLATRFNETVLSFQDPDGLHLELITATNGDKRKPWETGEVNATVATKGFYNTTLSLRKIDATANLLTEVFGYRLLKQEGNRHRFVTHQPDAAGIIDLLEMPDLPGGYNAAGTNHHIAFRMSDETTQMEMREKIASRGLNITPKINRDYFYSVYFREPGGVLFELATDQPGFTVDEPLDELGTHLKLPKQFEPARERIEKVLPLL
ncbi:MAG TPA: ring-cleaving dioxygenase, partial [Puia sp.]|nr:ring-cleaving dioxygenase [Puia sp.]